MNPRILNLKLIYRDFRNLLPELNYYYVIELFKISNKKISISYYVNLDIIDNYNYYNLIISQCNLVSNNSEFACYNFHEKVITKQSPGFLKSFTVHYGISKIEQTFKDEFNNKKLHSIYLYLYNYISNISISF